MTSFTRGFFSRGNEIATFQGQLYYYNGFEGFFPQFGELAMHSTDFYINSYISLAVIDMTKSAMPR